MADYGVGRLYHLQSTQKTGFCKLPPSENNFTKRLFFAVFPHKFFNATGSVNQRLFPGKEWVRCAGNVQGDQRILFSVRPFNRFIACHCGSRQKREVCSCVLKDDESIFRMNSFFHFALSPVWA